MSWGSVRGHDEQRDDLRRAMAAGRLPHAFLFAGPEGIGKRKFATTLAQALLCEDRDHTSLDPCGRCPSCLQVIEGSHPDVLTVAKPEDRQELPIRLIRDLCLDLGLKPMRGHRRVAIVDDADDLSDEAANAFLKTLEEPPPGSVLILIGTSAEVQLETILSRCRVLRFAPLSTPDLARILRDDGLVTDPDRAQSLASQADGSVARALALAGPELGPFRRGMIDDLARPESFDPNRFARRIASFVEEAGKESAPKRDRARVLIGELARFFRAILWQTAGLEPGAAEPADHAAVSAMATRLGPEDVFVLAERCLEADFQVRRNANRLLIFESLAHDIGRLLRPRA